MIEALQICALDPVLPAIGLGLSALALLAALWMSLRLMTLETRLAVAREIAEITNRQVRSAPDDHPEARHAIWPGRYRLLLLFLPSLLLLIGNSTLLYLNSGDDCNVTDQGVEDDGTAPDQ
jgi:hypothetical protein